MNISASTSNLCFSYTPQGATPQVHESFYHTGESSCLEPSSFGGDMTCLCFFSGADPAPHETSWLHAQSAALRNSRATAAGGRPTCCWVLGWKHLGGGSLPNGDNMLPNMLPNWSQGGIGSCVKSESVCHFFRILGTHGLQSKWLVLCLLPLQGRLHTTLQSQCPNPFRWPCLLPPQPSTFYVTNFPCIILCKPFRKSIAFNIIFAFQPNYTYIFQVKIKKQPRASHRGLSPHHFRHQLQMSLALGAGHRLRGRLDGGHPGALEKISRQFVSERC